MPEKSKLDVIVRIASFNRGAYLREALCSVLAQSKLPERIEIYDNCSQPNVYESIRDLINEDVRWCPTQENIGGVLNIERALRSVKTKYLYIMHDDDRILPDFLEKQVEYLDNNPDCVAVSCNANVIDQNGNAMGFDWFDRSTASKKYSNPEDVALLYSGSYLGFPSVVYVSEVVKSVVFRKNLGKCADVGLLSDISRHGCVAYQAMVLMSHRSHGEQDSADFPILELLALHMFLLSCAQTPANLDKIKTESGYNVTQKILNAFAKNSLYKNIKTVIKTAECDLMNWGVFRARKGRLETFFFRLIAKFYLVASKPLRKVS